MVLVEIGRLFGNCPRTVLMEEAFVVALKHITIPHIKRCLLSKLNRQLYVLRSLHSYSIKKDTKIKLLYIQLKCIVYSNEM